MAPATGTALLVLVAFVLPGFVALLIAERTYVVRRERSPFELLLIATYYSVISWGIIALATWPFGLARSDLVRWWREDSLGRLAGLGLLAILVVPAIVATFSRWWQQSEKLRPGLLKRLGIHETHATSTAWDALFERRKAAMVRVVLNDQRVLGGYYGAESFAPYAQESQDLFLEQRWRLDDKRWFLEPIESSQGLWLSAGSIVSLELYDPVTDEPATKAAKEKGGRAPAAPQGASADQPAAEAEGR
jgi:hypothetical protein